MKAVCNVTDLSGKLSKAISSGVFINAWCRQRLVELLALLNDISHGHAMPDSLGAVKSLAEIIIAAEQDNVCHDTAKMVLQTLMAHGEEFESHIETRNCPSGDCIRLSPAPCQMACPAGIDVPGYITLIARGRDIEAIELILQDNPLPWICGLVCTNPCEYKCVRGEIDRPVAIKNLKRFAAMQAMMQTGHGYRCPQKASDNGRKVCIVGAGPAGLSAGYFLALKGYRITIIDALPVAGGMMMVGIPRYRLPRKAIEREVGFIKELGIEFRLNTHFNKDITFEELGKEGFQACLIATGAHLSMSLGIPGERAFGPVTAATDLLREAGLGREPVLGKKIVVIGGGNVAIDSARTALRLGCDDITVLYRRTRSEMPASEEEILQAEEEGIRFSFLIMPVEIVGSDKKISGLRCLKTKLGPEDASGRRRPLPIDGSDYMIEVDEVISAIGQRTNPGDFISLEKLTWSAHGTVKVDSVSMTTSMEGVFAAGDLVTGPATIIEAVAGGKRAARGIDRHLSGLPRMQMQDVPYRRTRQSVTVMDAREKMDLKRPEMPLLDMSRRHVGFEQVELGYSEDPARREADRCLRCDICSRCGICVDVCRNEMGIDALSLGYLDSRGSGPTNFILTAERCIGCGACAVNCPTGAMQIVDRGNERVLSLCGIVMSRFPIECCEVCGTVLQTGACKAHMDSRVNAVDTEKPYGSLCFACKREKAAGRIAERYFQNFVKEPAICKVNDE